MPKNIAASTCVSFKLKFREVADINIMKRLR